MRTFTLITLLFATAIAARASAAEVTVPPWVDNPNMDGTVGAVGIAKPMRGAIAQMRATAIANGRVALARSIASHVETETKETVGEDGTVTSTSTTSRERVNAIIQGSTVKEMWIHPETGELYVWVVIDPKRGAATDVRGSMRRTTKAPGANAGTEEKDGLRERPAAAQPPTAAPLERPTLLPGQPEWTVQPEAGGALGVVVTSPPDRPQSEAMAFANGRVKLANTIAARLKAAFRAAIAGEEDKLPATVYAGNVTTQVAVDLERLAMVAATWSNPQDGTLHLWVTIAADKIPELRALIQTAARVQVAQRIGEHAAVSEADLGAAIDAAFPAPAAKPQAE